MQFVNQHLLYIELEAPISLNQINSLIVWPNAAGDFNMKIVLCCTHSTIHRLV
jgi:hypothetical protein